MDLDVGLAAFAAALRASPHNLLSAKALTELEGRHFPESEAFARALPRAQRLLDVGSGGGLPGVVVALVRSDLDVHLMEATGKKARFLEEVAQDLGLGLTIHHGRAEALATGDLAGSFDLVTARAVAPLDRLAAWAHPYLRVGGELHAIKGERWSEELEAALGVIRRARFRVVSTPVPGQGEDGTTPRVIVLRREA
jgi:16S rRNA (guanine527-N7)-methyltransferase